MLRAIALSLLLPLLAACGADNVYAPMQEVQSRAYRAEGGPTLTLLTAINNRTGSGGHSALMVSGSQRVIFDPAGTWWHPTAPERGDVIYGITPTMLDFYIDYHARPTYRVVSQEISVSPEIAERALQLVEAHGPAAKATCGQSVSGILRELGFGKVRRSWYPDRIMKDFETVQGVVRHEIRDDTVDEYSPGKPALRAVTDDGLVYAN
ncbi:hypothetical protein [Jannaschia rubra]|uniref:Lipoprotein n=1 Tax=Jannaschia rubra TaxID=282197 RepID=A0A0M6XMC2_9RHOB|nr:hypothetical protein [Jannaschia rubra]CTQ32239.1 hypothetical protein JAN5088_01002 [Jannaschia rubra]SFG49451.1 hypothetical protein SAMN04488517_105201 [Jannaschia rubra]